LNKFYVVTKGRNLGVFVDWKRCMEQVVGYPGGNFKSFSSINLSLSYFRNRDENFDENGQDTFFNEEKIIFPSLAVDASCSGNPGKMEYRGVFTNNMDIAFECGPFPLATNNIGEFLAIFEGLVFLKEIKSDMPIYSDSEVAINWIENKFCHSGLLLNQETEKLWDMAKNAQKHLNEEKFKNKILKWQTKSWGEIPADYGRKKKKKRKY